MHGQRRDGRAAEHGQAEGASTSRGLLLDKGANVNAQLKRRPPYRNVPQDRGGDSILSQGATPLLRAARAGDTPMVELLLEHGALVDLPSNQGVTPLMAAAGVEYGLRVTRGRNRTDEGVLVDDARCCSTRAPTSTRECSMEPRGESAAHLLVIEQRLERLQLRLSRPAGAEPARDTASHGAARRGDEGLHADRRSSSPRTARTSTRRTRTAARRSTSRRATTTSRSCAKPRSRTRKPPRSSKSSWPRIRRRPSSRARSSGTRQRRRGGPAARGVAAGRHLPRHTS